MSANNFSIKNFFSPSQWVSNYQIQETPQKMSGALIAFEGACCAAAGFAGFVPFLGASVGWAILSTLEFNLLNNRSLTHLHEQACQEILDAENPNQQAVIALVKDGNALGPLPDRGSGIQKLVRKVERATKVLNKTTTEDKKLLDVIYQHSDHRQAHVGPLLNAGAEFGTSWGEFLQKAIAANHLEDARLLLKKPPKVLPDNKSFADACESYEMFQLIKIDLDVTLDQIQARLDILKSQTVKAPDGYEVIYSSAEEDRKKSDGQTSRDHQEGGKCLKRHY